MHTFIFNDATRICTKCGVEQRHLVLDSFNKFSAPINRGYSRRSRFKLKVDKLLGFHNGPSPTDPIWSALEAHRGKMQNPHDVRKVLRSLKLKNKHYDSVKIFVDCFTNFNVAKECVIPSSRLRSNLLQLFDQVFRGWLKLNENTFFSYDFLLRRFLIILKSPLNLYCKPASCKRRTTRSLERMMSILSHGEQKNGNHMPEADHFRSARCLASNPHNRQHAVWRQLLHAFERRLNDTGDRGEYPLPSQLCSFGKLKDGTSTSNGTFYCDRSLSPTFLRDQIACCVDICDSDPKIDVS